MWKLNRLEEKYVIYVYSYYAFCSMVSVVLRSASESSDVA